jgi:hypothetical protein
MLLLKYLILMWGIGIYASAAVMVVYDACMAETHRRLLARGAAEKH